MNSYDESRPWLAMVNPNAGKGKGKKDWEQIAALLEKAGLRFTLQLTESKGHAIVLTRDALRKGYRKIITIGGDGTLNEVVNGLFTEGSCIPADISLGLIPVGTGNDWGRMFGIGPGYENAVNIIRSGREMLHDVGLVKYFECDEQKERYFINIAGLGFESVVVRKTNFQKERGHGGKAIYFYNLLTSLISYKNTNADIIVDGVKKSACIFSVNVGNGRYCGRPRRQFRMTDSLM